MEEEKYTPINCNLYDELEILAMRQQKTSITYTDNGNEKTLEGVLIKNVYSRKKVEYLLLENGTTIRLDQLVTVDCKPFKNDQGNKC